QSETEESPDIDETSEVADLFGDAATRMGGPKGATPVNDAAGVNSASDGSGASVNGATPGVEAVVATIETLRKRGFGRLLTDPSTAGAVVFDEMDPAKLNDRSPLRVVVDRVQLGTRVQDDTASDEVRRRLTDSIETAYMEGGGAAWAIEVPAP